MRFFISIINRAKNFMAKDIFAFLGFSRMVHYRLNTYLWRKYAPILGGVKLFSVPNTDYLLPGYLVSLPRETRICISGGIQFHTELEDFLLAEGFLVHAYEIDPVSWDWFDSAKGSNDNFILHKAGLYDSFATVPFYGDRNRNTSPSVLSSFHSDFNVEEIGFCQLVPLSEAFTSCGLSSVAIVKLDIEGVASKVVLKSLRDGLFVSCFVFEAERPVRSGSNCFDYFQELLQVIAMLEESGYVICCYPRSDKCNSFSTLCTAYKSL
jgi:hypothetical protein